jgi:hypothetical protein
MTFTNQTGDYMLLDNGASSSWMVLLGNVTNSSRFGTNTVSISLDQLGLANTVSGAATDIRTFNVTTGVRASRAGCRYWTARWF